MIEHSAGFGFAEEGHFTGLARLAVKCGSLVEGATKLPMSAQVCAAIGSSSSSKVYHRASPTPGRAAQTSAERAVQAEFFSVFGEGVMGSSDEGSEKLRA